MRAILKKIVTPTALRFGALAIAGTLSAAGSPSVAAPASSKPTAHATTSAQGNWAVRSTTLPNGTHLLGNPNAMVKMVEYVSYTCPHCAHFHKESGVPLKTTVLPKGQVSLTIHNVLRNPIDLTVAMLTNCGDPQRYFTRHDHFMDTQSTWLPKAQSFTKAQQARWYQGSMPTRMRAIASDFGFYAKMESWGMTRAQTDACFANQATLDKLVAQQGEGERMGITGTPSIALNGSLLDVNDWPSVSQAISSKLAELRAGNI